MYYKGYMNEHGERTISMISLNATHARKNLYRLIDEVSQSHQPVTITGKNNSAVLIAKEDWKAMQETLYLSSIPGMVESIREGMSTPIDEYSDEPGW